MHLAPGCCYRLHCSGLTFLAAVRNPRADAEISPFVQGTDGADNLDKFLSVNHPARNCIGADFYRQRGERDRVIGKVIMDEQTAGRTVTWDFIDITLAHLVPHDVLGGHQTTRSERRRIARGVLGKWPKH